MLMRPRREIGIAFTAPMIRAIIEGRKTETRRLASDTGPLAKAAPGDLLWIKEAFWVIDWDAQRSWPRIRWSLRVRQDIARTD